MQTSPSKQARHVGCFCIYLLMRHFESWHHTSYLPLAAVAAALAAAFAALLPSVPEQNFKYKGTNCGDDTEPHCLIANLYGS
jgi:hypothetical protein